MCLYVCVFVLSTTSPSVFSVGKSGRGGHPWREGRAGIWRGRRCVWHARVGAGVGRREPRGDDMHGRRMDGPGRRECSP